MQFVSSLEHMIWQGRLWRMSIMTILLYQTRHMFLQTSSHELSALRMLQSSPDFTVTTSFI